MTDVQVVYSSLCETDLDVYREYLGLVSKALDSCRDATTFRITAVSAVSRDASVVDCRGVGELGEVERASLCFRAGVRELDAGGNEGFHQVVSASCGGSKCASGSGPLADANAIDSGGSGFDVSNGEVVADGEHTAADDGCVNGIVDSSNVVRAVRDGVARGKNYERNKRKREQGKQRRSQAWRQQSWRRVDESGGCISDESVTGTVKTVDSRTAEEIEAARTLAVRRAVENKLAIAVGSARLAGFKDKSKTDALNKLAAARMEQRINEAKAKSQASYKKCDESLKSLGSTGSAGEFALKQQVKDAKQDKAMLKYVQSQADLMARHVSREVLDAVAAIPAPVFEVEHDVFGECPSDYDEDEAYAYDMELNNRQYEQEMRTWNPDPCPGWK
jgi:hypothetical protein